MGTLKLAVSPEGVRDRLALLLPDKISQPELGEDGFALMLGWPVGQRIRKTGSVIISQGDEDGVPWLHASIARIDRMPRYDELVALHKAVFGSRYAYQVFAPPSAHVNIHPYALHLWCRLDDGDGRVLPDFGRFGTI